MVCQQTRKVVVAVALALVGAGPVCAQSGEAPRRDAKKGDFLRFPLGPLGARGEVLAGSEEITVLDVAKGSPAAQAGLARADVIVAIDDAVPPKHVRTLEVLDGPMRALGDAIDRAERTGEALRLAVRRGRECRDLSITLARRGSLDPIDAGAEGKAGQFYDGICRDLLRSQCEDGSWRARTGDDATRYVTALCGLALLGRGDPSHRDALAKVATFLAGPDRRGTVSADLLQPAGLSNWHITMSGIFLAEYVLATGERQWLPTLQHLCDCMAERQTENGRYGHGIQVGYGGKGFNIINTHAHLLWALAERAGCRIDSDAWSRSLAEIIASTGDNGGVRYWTLQTGYWDAAARTGQMALALALRGERPELAAKMAAYLAAHSRRMREAHAMGSIGMIFGTLALRRLDRSAWAAHLHRWRWYLDLMRLPDDSAGYVGGKRNNGGDHYLREEHVANAIAGLMFASARGHLHLSGNEQNGWFGRLRENPVR